MEDESMEQSENPAASKEKPHWRKTKDGKWAICGPQEIMKPGEKIEVFRKDGSSSTHILSSDSKDLGEPFENNNEPGTMNVFAYKFEEFKE